MGQRIAEDFIKSRVKYLQDHLNDVTKGRSRLMVGKGEIQFLLDTIKRRERQLEEALIAGRHDNCMRMSGE